MADPWALPEGSSFTVQPTTEAPDPFALPEGSTFSGAVDEADKPKPRKPKEKSVWEKLQGLAQATRGMNVSPEQRMEGLRDAATIVTGDNEFNIGAMQSAEEAGVGDQVIGAFSSNEAFRDKLLSENPNMSLDTDNAGNEYIKKDGKPYKYVEQPGIGVTDIVETAANVGVSLVPGLGTAATVGRVANVGRGGRALAAGLAEGATALGIEHADMDEGENYWNVALAGLSPAVAETFSAARGALTSAQRKRYIEEGKKYAQDKGFDFEQLKDGTLEAFGLKARGKLKNQDITDESILTMNEQGIPLTTGQATGDVARMDSEAAVAQTEGDWGVKPRVSKRYAEQEVAIDEFGTRQMEKGGATRSEVETGRELNQKLSAEKAEVKAAADADQTARDVAVRNAPDINPEALEPVQKSVNKIVEDMGIVSARNKKAYPISKKFMPELSKDIDNLVKAGKDVEITPAVPYKRAVKEGNVQKQIDREMRYMKVKPEDASYVRLRLDDMRDGTPEQMRKAKAQLRDKGYSVADINRAEKNIVGVRRPAPATPAQKAVIRKGQKARFNEIQRINEDINGNLRAAKGQDKVALKRAKDDFEAYVKKDAAKMFADDPASLGALASMNKANSSWRLYKEAFSQSKEGKDRIGKIIEQMTSKKNPLSPEEVVDTIVGGNNIKLKETEMRRLVEAAGTRGGDTGDLLAEAIERRIWGNHKTGLATRTPKQSYEMMSQLLHGNRKDLGNILYPVGSKRRADREAVLKVLDQLQRSKTGKGSEAMFNGLYARLNIGGMRMVLGADQTIGRWMRRRIAVDAANPQARSKFTGDLLARDYAKAAALTGAAKQNQTGEEE